MNEDTYFLWTYRTRVNMSEYTEHEHAWNMGTSWGTFFRQIC